MTRYFLTRLSIEGFRGINNEGDPLIINFRTDAVNSVFAANGLGKSSIFDALSYAITGKIEKLDLLPAADSPTTTTAIVFTQVGTPPLNLHYHQMMEVLTSQSA